MCAIVACYKSTLAINELRKTILKAGKKLRHRGPDSNGLYISDNGIALLHERLSIIDPESGAQPFDNQDIILSVNGEIYNYKELKEEYVNINVKYEFKTKSDCEIIIPLYLEYGINKCINLLSGMFSFILYDKKNNLMYVVRDHIGITPLYQGYSTDGSIWFASEMKALTDICNNIQHFPPGNYWRSDDILSYYKWDSSNWLNKDHIGQDKLDYDTIYCSFLHSVRTRMQSDVPWGLLLSGGLDSSLVASIVCKYIPQNSQWSEMLHSFSIGLEGSPDLKAAQKVADYIGISNRHHTYTYTIQEGIDVLSDVIYHLETYDITTIRASTPMFLLSRKIRALGIKMVLSGEGADEIFGGYLYFHKAPNKHEFHKETQDKLKKLYLYDCLRANKSTAAWGIEVRVPFLDKDFLNMAMNIDPEEKMIKDGKMEKHIMRQTFCRKEATTHFGDFLPDDILWRQKEQFSDGVSGDKDNWIEELKKYAENEVSDRQMEFAHILFPYNTPKTKEGYLYRKIFTEHFPLESYAKTVEQEDTIACSTKRAIDWDESFKNNKDPSGRVIDVYNNSY